MPDWIRGTASFDKSILLKHEHIVGRNIDDHIVSVTVPVITIEQLLKRHSAIKKITAIQIDTEGHDFLGREVCYRCWMSAKNFQL